MPEGCGRQRRHLLGIGQPQRSGAGIGISGTDHNPSHVLCRDSLPAKPDRRGDHAITSKNARCPGGPIANHQGQVQFFTTRSHATMNAGISKGIRQQG